VCLSVPSQGCSFFFTATPTSGGFRATDTTKKKPAQEVSTKLHGGGGPLFGVLGWARVQAGFGQTTNKPPFLTQNTKLSPWSPFCPLVGFWENFFVFLPPPGANFYPTRADRGVLVLGSMRDHQVGGLQCKILFFLFWGALGFKQKIFFFFLFFALERNKKTLGWGYFFGWFFGGGVFSPGRFFFSFARSL